MSMSIEALFQLMLVGTGETLFMTLLSTLGAYLLGLPLGVLLTVTDKDGIKPMPVLNTVTGTVVNILRSVPFLILMIAVLPLAKIVIGTRLGIKAATFALIIAAFPFVARMVESAIREVDKGVIEAARSMGASTFQIIWKVLVPEARTSLVLGAAISSTTILGYSAMAGILGAGGLGAIAINYGYYRTQYDIMYIAVIVLIVLVQLSQWIGDRITKSVDKR